MKVEITDSMKRHPLYKSYRRYLIVKVIGYCVVGPIILALYGVLGVMGVLAIKGGIVIVGILSFLVLPTLPIILSVFCNDFKELRWRFKCAVKFARSHPSVRVSSIFDKEIHIPPLFD
jgi:hypothetical protein